MSTSTTPEPNPSTPGPIRALTTDPTYLDVELRPNETFSHTIDPSHSAFVYPFEASLSIRGRELSTNNAGVLAGGDVIELAAASRGSQGAFRQRTWVMSNSVLLTVRI